MTPASDVHFDVDISSFLASGDRFVSGLRSRAGEVMSDTAGDVAVEMALATPPGSLSVQGGSALARGEAAVTANVLRVVTPVSGAKGAPSVGSIVKAHWRNGRTMRPTKKVIVSRADFERYLGETLPKVGYTAGGWETAAAALGKSLPGWIEDRNGPGSVDINLAGDRLEIVIRNEVPWITQLAGVPQRLDRIMETHREPLFAELAAAMRQEAKAAGF